MASVVARYAVNHLSAASPVSLSGLPPGVPGREGKSPALALKSLEVFISPCVVAFPPFPPRSNDSSHAHAAVALINPANERLEGAKFSPGDAHKYLPPLAGGDAFRYPLVYPEQCVDGLVHEAVERCIFYIQTYIHTLVNIIPPYRKHTLYIIICFDRRRDRSTRRDANRLTRIMDEICISK